MVRLLVVAGTLAACTFHLPGPNAQQDSGGDASDGPVGDDMMPPPPDVPVPEGWALKRTLTITNTSNGALTGFAIAVFLDGNRISYAATQPNGEDLRFTDADGTTLAHEIEVWNPGGRSVVWVNVPTIAANTTTDITMLYSNPQASDSQNAAAVWDASYVGVWHLVDAHDSTGKLTSTNVGATPIDGQVGPAMSFSGAGQYVDTGTTEYLATWTVEAFMNPATAGTQGSASSVVSGFPDYMILWKCNQSQFCRTVLYSEITGATHATGFSANVDVWTYVAGTYDGVTLRAFSGVNSQTQLPTNRAPAAAAFTTKIGTRSDLAGDYNGAIDEVRISNLARSADYVRAQVRTMTDTYVMYGAEQPN